MNRTASRVFARPCVKKLAPNTPKPRNVRRFMSKTNVAPSCHAIVSRHGLAMPHRSLQWAASADDTIESRDAKDMEEFKDELKNYPHGAYTNTDMIEREACKGMVDEGNINGVITFAKQGSRFAQGYLGALYLMGEKISQDDVLARKWLQKGAAQEDFESLFHYGNILAEGSGGDVDLEGARAVLQRGATRGNVEAMTKLGVMMRDGQGGDEDIQAAGKLFRQAAKKDEREAMLFLAQWLMEGHGGEADEKEIMFWFSKSQEQTTAQVEEQLRMRPDQSGFEENK